MTDALNRRALSLQHLMSMTSITYLLDNQRNKN
jgi:hypothetical protein